MNIPFEEVVCCDFEYYGREGNRPTVVCLVARELRSGRKFRLWRDQLPPKPPYRIDSRTLFVAHYAAADKRNWFGLICHNILTPTPSFVVLQLSAEQQPHAGLLHALDCSSSTAFRCRQRGIGGCGLRGPP
jgi:hypothetical protein